MNQQKETGPKALCEMSCAKTSLQPKENGLNSAANEPRPKYGAHSGLKFKFNLKKPTKLFDFDSGPGHEKGKSSKIPRSTEKRKSEDVPVRTSMEKLKISEESEKCQNKVRSFSEGNAPEDLIISRKSKNSNLHIDAIKSLLGVTEHLPQPSNAVKPKLSNTVKPRLKPHTSYDSKLPLFIAVKPLQPLNSAKNRLLNTPKPQKQPSNAAKPQSSILVKPGPAKPIKPQPPSAETDSKVIHKKYGAHVGLKLKFQGVKPTTVVQPFNFERRNSRSRKGVIKDEEKETQSKETNACESSHQKK